MKQPQCQKCEQNAFLRVMLSKQSHRIGQKKWYFAGCALPR